MQSRNDKDFQSQDQMSHDKVRVFKLALLAPSWHSSGMNESINHSHSLFAFFWVLG